MSKAVVSGLSGRHPGTAAGMVAQHRQSGGLSVASSSRESFKRKISLARVSGKILWPIWHTPFDWLNFRSRFVLDIFGDFGDIRRCNHSG
jgi:hypothetical protein